MNIFRIYADKIKYPLFIILILAFANPNGLFAQNQQILKEYPRFKTYAEMTNIASTRRLQWRIFYRPSTGRDAKWFDAVKKGDLETVKKMVDSGQNIEAKDENSLGQTALGWAAFIGYLDMVKYLVGKGANLFATDRADVSHSFKSAILGGDIDVIEYLYPLLKNNIDINAQDIGDGETALMVAVDNHRIDAVNFLIKNGADVNIVSQQRGQDAYTYACRRNFKDMQAILTKAGAINHKLGRASCE